MTARTLYDKLWDSHVVREEADGTALLYIDRHLVHEVTSPQAFEGLKLAGRKPWRMQSVVATADHNTPTKDWNLGIQDPISRMQVETLDDNMREHGAKAYFPFLDRRQGIVHVIGPEQGATLPGMTVVCGDSHTSTHGAFAALAFGIGTSEVEHVLATQCLLIKKAKSMLVRVDGRLAPGVTAKDLVLAIIGRIGTGGRQRPRDRVRGRGRARAVDGSADDDVQHVDRGRRARGHDRRRRAHARLHQGTRVRADRRDVGSRGRAVAHACAATTARGSTRRTCSTRRRCARRSRGARRRRWSSSIEDRVPDPDRETRHARAATAWSARCTTWGSAEHADDPHPHRQGVHRLVHQLAHRGPAAGGGGRARPPHRRTT